MKKTVILSGISALLLVIAFILALVSNSINNMEHLTLSVTALVIAFVAFAADAYLSTKYSNHNIILVLVGVVALVFLFVALANLILDSTVLAAAQFTYDAVNVSGWQALITRAVSIVCVIAGMVLLSVKSFQKD